VSVPLLHGSMRRASLPAGNLSPAVPMAPVLEPQPAGMASRPTRLRRAHPRYRTAHPRLFRAVLRLLSLVGKVFGRRVALPGCLPARGAGTGRGVAGQADPHCRRRELCGGLPTRERRGSPSPRGALPRDLNGRLFPSNVEPVGFEPTTSGMPHRCSPKSELWPQRVWGRPGSNTPCVGDRSASEVAGLPHVSVARGGRRGVRRRPLISCHSAVEFSTSRPGAGTGPCPQGARGTKQGRHDLNVQRLVLETSALPVELRPYGVVSERREAAFPVREAASAVLEVGRC
jgi:hypothetical protein